MDGCHWLTMAKRDGGGIETFTGAAICRHFNAVRCFMSRDRQLHS